MMAHAGNGTLMGSFLSMSDVDALLTRVLEQCANVAAAETEVEGVSCAAVAGCDNSTLPSSAAQANDAVDGDTVAPVSEKPSLSSSVAAAPVASSFLSSSSTAPYSFILQQQRPLQQCAASSSSASVPLPLGFAPARRTAPVYKPLADASSSSSSSLTTAPPKSAEVLASTADAPVAIVDISEPLAALPEMSATGLQSSSSAYDVRSQTAAAPISATVTGVLSPPDIIQALMPQQPLLASVRDVLSGCAPDTLAGALNCTPGLVACLQSWMAMGEDELRSEQMYVLEARKLSHEEGLLGACDIWHRLIAALYTSTLEQKLQRLGALEAALAALAASSEPSALAAAPRKNAGHPLQSPFDSNKLSEVRLAQPLLQLQHQVQYTYQQPHEPPRSPPQQHHQQLLPYEQWQQQYQKQQQQHQQQIEISQTLVQKWPGQQRGTAAQAASFSSRPGARDA